MIGRVGILLGIVLLGIQPARAADSGFTRFIASLWPEAQAAGVSRATFDAETRGLEPDYKLPDLILPGRPATGAPSQAEFVQVPADYIKEASIARGGATADGEASLRLERDRSAFRRARHRGTGDLGPRNRLWPLHAALRCGAGAGDASLCRPPQGSVPHRVHSGAEDHWRWRSGTQGYALVLGRRHRSHAIPPIGILQARRRFRW